jgi:hypothetical protein
MKAPSTFLLFSGAVVVCLAFWCSTALYIAQSTMPHLVPELERKPITLTGLIAQAEEACAVLATNEFPGVVRVAPRVSPLSRSVADWRASVVVDHMNQIGGIERTELRVLLTAHTNATGAHVFAQRDSLYEYQQQMKALGHNVGANPARR